MSAGTDPLCPACGTPLSAGARFCESCGAATGATGVAEPASRPSSWPAGAGEPLGDAPISAPTRLPAASLPDPPAMTRRPCAECGGEVGPDLYCTSCGTKAPSEREHFRERPAAWVAGVCDRGITHARNEDALAVLAAPEPGSRAVLVVLDGVSNSIDSDVASLAGARAAREVLRLPLPAGMGTPESRAAAVAKTFADTVRAANAAIVASTDPDSPNPASATIVVAVLEGSRLHVANIGDSRAYWLPDEGPGVQVSTDHSLAQAQMEAGVPREVAESSPQAHAITQWLGRDSPDLEPRVASLDVTAPGWVLVCSDGLWNYASTPEALQARIAETGTHDAGDLALALVAFAHARGGQDNITVALARVGQNADHPDPGTAAADPAADGPGAADAPDVPAAPQPTPQGGPTDG
ncbi:protein phosphatase 2C domain-containing protein [Nocardioides sp. GY 10113]|uniref:protein phosphatase 2C domain-containing protein n=1 Tax=Nocardioides sp. GY 10113 TaxID=2569761 RepID=UPI001F0EFE5C|nr:protein phosphatase 2C domain-containing protein [Nocardioides sp. GY 10113]